MFIIHDCYVDYRPIMVTEENGCKTDEKYLENEKYLHSVKIVSKSFFKT